jgi:hypothetical protein
MSCNPSARFRCRCRANDVELIKIWRVKPDVGNVRNDRSDLIEPFDGDDSPGLFG